MPYPQKFGQPCWVPEQVSKVISLTAHTSAESAPYFLAAHSPFDKITDSKSSGRQLTEEQVFKELFSPARGEVQAFVKGEPGTGKSHLIRWLKLRAEDAKTRGELDFANFKLVLVSRGNGSLKDALGQIVAQLGNEFSSHTTRIRGAIEKLSDHAARDTLLSSLALEIGTHWSASHPDIPIDLEFLKNLAAALGPNTGFGEWMKRDGGVVHRVIRRLTEDSSVDDRTQFPEFSPEDFNVPINYLGSNKNQGKVIILAEDLDQDNDLRELATKVLNMALTNAVRELTGLRGSDLLEIFNEIRRDLGPKQQLAVFIEDVSVTGIDQDIINAFEPRSVDGLSRMVAILGITNLAWGSSRFPDNQKQRATFVFEVGGKVAQSWATDRSSVADFTARYLNAVRMNDDSIRDLAVNRFSGDVARSACDDCAFQKKCFASFGNSELPNGIKIGLFPFNRNAPQMLLASLNEAYYESQRGLLDQVMLPVLDKSYTALQGNEFPEKIQFSVNPAKLKFDWSAFAANYLGGVRWSDQVKNRARFLADYWTDASTISEAASQLEPMLAPLGLPQFSSIVTPPEVCPKCYQIRCICEDSPPQICHVCSKNPCLCDKEDPEHGILLSALDAWGSGSSLSKDVEFRKMVAALIRNSFSWSDERGIPITVSKTGAQRLIDGYAFVKIEGQQANPTNQLFFITFKRTKETQELLESLSHFERRGKTWAFKHGEIHKRKLSRWLRKNTAQVLESINPEPSSLVVKARNCAIKTLSLISCLRDRRKMPANAVDRLDVLFKAIWDTNSRPCVLSNELEQIVSDLESKHAAIRGFVIREFGAGQGDSEPKDFIDPSPILDILDEFANKPEVEPPPTQVASGFWKSRFGPVSNLQAYTTLADRMEKERKAIQSGIEVARAFAKATGFEEKDLRENLGNSLKELIEVIGLQRGGQHKKAVLPLPNPEFDKLWESKTIQNSDRRSSWTVAMERAMGVSDDKDVTSLLVFDPTKFKECIDVLRIVEKFLALIDKHMHDEEIYKGGSGDSRSELLNVLTQIEEMAAQNESDEQTDL